MRRLLLVPIALLLALPAAAQTDSGTVEFVELSGLLDDRVMRFAIDAIEDAAARGDTELVVLQIDSRGVVGSADVHAELVDVVSDPPLPVVTWIGPAPAVALGGAGQIAAIPDRAFAAPGSEIGFTGVTIAGDQLASDLVGPAGSRLAVEEVGDIEVSDQTAAPRQLAQLLDGRTFLVRGEETVVSSLVPVDGGETVSIVVRQPGWWDGFLRLASTPEAAFFLLVSGLTVAAFEFYAIGPGIAAGVAAVCLLLASYGVAVLPVRWSALVAVVASIWLLAVSYQRGVVLWLNVAGLGVLTAAGFFFTDADPLFSPGAPGVLLTVGAAAFFFLLAMPTVARSRFSTQTIGREGLVGRSGIAASDFTPDGVVEVDGARWQAFAHREAGLSAGDPIRVLGVDGVHLEVGPLD